MQIWRTHELGDPIDVLRLDEVELYTFWAIDGYLGDLVKLQTAQGLLNGCEADARNLGLWENDASLTGRCLYLRGSILMLEAYRLGCELHGEAAMCARFEQSVVRLLTGMFRVGLFDDPFLDFERSRATVGCAEFRAAGEAADIDGFADKIKSGEIKVPTAP